MRKVTFVEPEDMETENESENEEREIMNNEKW